MILGDAPVFLVGSVRSGTTLLRLMLDHHPKIAFNLESAYLVTQISDDKEYPNIEQYRAWLRNDRVFQHSHFSIDERLDFVELVNDFLHQKRLRDKKEIVGATVHLQFRKLRWLWPQAKYIHICRDGRDVASSVMRMGWAGNVYVAADRWLEAEKEWDELCPMLGKDEWIEIRYEDLVASPKLHLERICTFLGVEYSEQMFDYVSRTSYESPDVNLNYQWKTRLRKVDVQRLEEKLGGTLVSRGYQLSRYPRISISGATRRYLYLQSRVGILMFRLGRYGIGLTLCEAFSRRVGLKGVHQNAIRRINRIVDSTLK